MFVIIVMKLNEFFDNIKDINDIVESIQDKEIKRKHPLAGGLQGQSALLAAGLFLYSFLHPHNWRTSLTVTITIVIIIIINAKILITKHFLFLLFSSPQLAHLTAQSTIITTHFLPTIGAPPYSSPSSSSSLSTPTFWLQNIFLFLLFGVFPCYPWSLVCLLWVKYGMSQTRNHLVWW